MTSSKPDCLPRALSIPTNSILLGLKTSAHEFGEDTNIQSTAEMNAQAILGTTVASLHRLCHAILVPSRNLRIVTLHLYRWGIQDQR